MASNISIRLMFIALLIGVGNTQAPIPSIAESPSPSIAEAPTSIIGVPSNAQAPSPDSTSLLGLGDSKATNPLCATTNLLTIINTVVKNSLRTDKRMGASLLRLHFHDCFVNGCDGSVLLDDNSTTGFAGEKNAAPNAGTLRGFDVIDTIKTMVERACPRTVSCADILAVAARDAVVALGGPSWPLVFGRKDSTNASTDDANNILPGPGSDLSDLISTFSAQGFTTAEMVALSGSHTIGQSNCSFFRNRIYTETNIDPKFRKATQAICPQSGGDENLSPLDVATPNAFNNDYYKNLVAFKGLLHSDQTLFNNGSTDAQVKNYVANPARFFTDFSKAMVKMAALKSTSTSGVGQIRKNCHRVN